MSSVAETFQIIKNNSIMGLPNRQSLAHTVVTHLAPAVESHTGDQRFKVYLNYGSTKHTNNTK